MAGVMSGAVRGSSLLVLAAAGGAGKAGEPLVPLGLPREPLLVVFEAPEAEVELGRALFFDPILSRDRSVSCASCHAPEHGFADPAPRSAGVGGRRTPRHAPTLVNRALGEAFMWDGRAASLEEQVLLPIENELEMDLALPAAVERLTTDPRFGPAFAGTFDSAPTAELVARALAAFVRRQLSGGSRVDEFHAGRRDALSPAERGGLWLFESRAGCWRCHSGPNFSDESFHNTGIGQGAEPLDVGRAAVTGDPADTGAFKTPTLRGLVASAPYMHDGSLATLEDVVEFYRRGGHPGPHLDPALKPIEMTDRDAANLVAFLKALTPGE